MDVYFFKKVVVICCLVSMFVLSIYTYYYKPKMFDVYDLIHNPPKNNLEKTISTQGTIREPTTKNNHLFFNICSGSTCISCVIFKYKDSERDIIYNNKTIKITGKYTTYNNQKEIIVESVENVVT
jgi:aspartyl/asparaginyl-tRNA synthetase